MTKIKLEMKKFVNNNNKNNSECYKSALINDYDNLNINDINNSNDNINRK